MNNDDRHLDRLIDLATDPAQQGEDSLDVADRAELQAQKAVQRALSNLEPPHLAPEERRDLHEKVSAAQRGLPSTRTTTSRPNRSWLSRAIPALIGAVSIIAAAAVGINLLQSDRSSDGQSSDLESVFDTVASQNVSPSADEPVSATATADGESLTELEQETAAQSEPGLEFEAEAAQNDASRLDSQEETVLPLPAWDAPLEQWGEWAEQTAQLAPGAFLFDRLAEYAAQQGLICWDIPAITEARTVLFALSVERGVERYEAYYLEEVPRNLLYVIGADCQNVYSYPVG